MTFSTFLWYLPHSYCASNKIRLRFILYNELTLVIMVVSYYQRPFEWKGWLFEQLKCTTALLIIILIISLL